jgi:hypothetical protein
MNMITNRFSARQRGMLEVEPRRAAGYRAVAVMAVLGLVTMIGLGSAPGERGASTPSLHSESYGFEAPASVGEAFRREAFAVAPATGVYEEPELVVHHEVHG